MGKIYDIAVNAGVPEWIEAHHVVDPTRGKTIPSTGEIEMLTPSEKAVCASLRLAENDYIASRSRGGSFAPHARSRNHGKGDQTAGEAQKRLEASGAITEDDDQEDLVDAARTSLDAFEEATQNHESDAWRHVADAAAFLLAALDRGAPPYAARNGAPGAKQPSSAADDPFAGSAHRVLFR